MRKREEGRKKREGGSSSISSIISDELLFYMDYRLNDNIFECIGLDE